MAISEIPQSGYAYRVQSLDKDQASKHDSSPGGKKKKSDDKGKKPDDSARSERDRQEGRINLIA